MTIVWLVDANRFVQEYYNHVSDQALKHVNWMVDIKTGFIKLFISATNGFEMYCYIHDGTIDTLPVQLKDSVSMRGAVLGTMELEDSSGIEKGITELVNEFRGLRFSQVTKV